MGDDIGTGPFAAKALPDSASPSAGGVNGVSAGRVASDVGTLKFS